MYTTFNTLEELCQAIDTDKHWTGAESALRDRYPMRFVLFEDFTDFYAFTGACQNLGVFVQSIEGWLPEGQDDLLLTYSQLADRFVSDPTQVVRLHQHVRVRVIGVDLRRQRISLSMKGVKR